ncbi:MAG: hypothetical protein DVB29_04865 [Verrucomicrobia bacterium]|nr:MAG: hypothetical protein DVB29_04865 [Verrucomicrobiota bacterium]
MNRALLSLRRLWILACMTFQELMHQQVGALFALLFLFFLALGGLLLHYSFQERGCLLEEMNGGLFSLFLSLLAIVVSAPLLISHGEEIMILARVLPRYEYFLGRFLGILLLLVIATGSFGLLMLQTFWKPNGEGRFFFVMLLASFLKASLLAAMTLLISTIASSSLFTIMSAMALYMIGHLEKSASILFVNLTSLHGWLLRIIQIPFILIPDLSFFNIIEMRATPLSEDSSYVLSMLQLGIIYGGVYLLMGCFLFQRREFK